MNTTKALGRSVNHSVLASLRRLIPEHGIGFAEALHIAELQADRLLELTGDDPTMLDQRIARLPRICLQHRPMPTSGLSYWDGQAWVICLNQTEPATRQRFTLLHEYKHIIDHGSTSRLFTGDRDRSATEQAEQVADYFAGAALIPRLALHEAMRAGLVTISDLAEYFHVSSRAIEVRLDQTGLRRQFPRCAAPSLRSWRPRNYQHPNQRNASAA